MVAPQLDQICADFSQSQRMERTSAHNQQPSDTRGGSDGSMGAAHSPGLRCAGTRSSSTMSVLKGSRPEHLPVSERVRSMVSGQGGSKDSACHEQDSPFVGHVYGSGFCDTRMRQRGGSVRTERGRTMAQVEPAGIVPLET